MDTHTPLRISLVVLQISNFVLRISEIHWGVLRGMPQGCQRDAIWMSWGCHGDATRDAMRNALRIRIPFQECPMDSHTPLRLDSEIWLASPKELSELRWLPELRQPASQPGREPASQPARGVFEQKKHRRIFRIKHNLLENTRTINFKLIFLVKTTKMLNPKNPYSYFFAQILLWLAG